MSMKSIAVLGAGGGIGAAVVELLASRDDVQIIHAAFHRLPAGGALAINAGNSCSLKIRCSALDGSDEIALAAWIEGLGSIDWLINCVGMLHDQSQGPEKTIRAFDSAHFRNSMDSNCLPTLLLGKYAHRVLKDSPRGVFAAISARVGSIQDNQLGGWYSYRASKAALNMALKCLSIEWARSMKNVRVVALHPGTTDTRLSQPFQQNVPQGKLFTATKTAHLLVEQIERLHNYPSGRFIAYDGEEIPW
jgi:NAD(P)-dependent dehydrogenase (short-subunit alcohol dehydrogenase family)